MEKVITLDGLMIDPDTVWEDYKEKLPEDGQYVISFSSRLHKEFKNCEGFGIICDKFNKEIWDKKEDEHKCDYWIANEDLIRLVPVYGCCGD